MQQLGLEENDFLLERLGLRSTSGDSASAATKLCTYCRNHLMDYIPSNDVPKDMPKDSDDYLKVVGKKCPTGVVGIMLDPQEKPDMKALETEWTLHDSVISERVTDRLRAIVSQLVAAQGLSNEWVAPVVRLASAAARDVLPVSGDSRDIRKYVRIKIVPGGTIENSNYFAAFSFGRKNVMLKGMQSQFVEPRILLLNFPIDYLRESRLVSIDDVMAQERAHLRILVSKIAAIKPDVVFVGKMVSYTAAEFFLQEHITVFSNVKPSVMEALARYTGGAVIKSASTLSTLAAMEQQRADEFLGRCHTLSSVDYKIGPSLIKTLFFLEGSPRLGGTIILRGSLPPVLEEVKRVVRFAIFVAHSLSLEHAFIAEELLHKVESRSIMSDEDCVCKICTRSTSITPRASPTLVADDDENNNSEVNTSGNANKLTTPSEKDSENPILMYEICGKMPSRQYPVVSVSLTHECKVPNVIIKSPRKVMLTLSDFRLQDVNIPGYISLRRRHEHDWIIEPFLVQDSKATNNNCVLEHERVTHVIWRGFDIAHPARDYQYILVLHAIALRNGAKTQCVPYEIAVFEFYGEKERCLGQFLEDCCFCSDRPCKVKECKESMRYHERSFLHNNGRIDIVIDDATRDMDAMIFLNDIGVPSNIFMQPSPSNTIYHWRYCTECHRTSCVVPLSKESWNLSFGKFLEILFYSAGSSFLNFCPHSAGNHIICFLRGPLLVRVTYTPLNTFKIVPPSLVKTYNAHDIAVSKEKYLSDLCDGIKKTVNEIFDDIVSVLHSIKQYADTLFRISSTDSEKDRHPLSLEIEAFKELFIDSMKANRECIEAEKEDFMKRLDNWDSCDILELGNIKWDLHFAYKRWIKILHELLEPSKSMTRKKYRTVLPTRTFSTLQQMRPPQEQGEGGAAASPPFLSHLGIQSLHQSLRRSVQIPPTASIDVPIFEGGRQDPATHPNTESVMMASSDDGKVSRVPWTTKFASQFTKTENTTAPGTVAPRSVESVSLSLRDTNMANSLEHSRSKTSTLPNEATLPLPPSINDTNNSVPSPTTPTNNNSNSRKSVPLSVPQITSSTTSVMISASPVRVSMCSSPLNAVSFEKNRPVQSLDISPERDSTDNNAPIVSVPTTVPSIASTSTITASINNSTIISTNMQASSPNFLSHVVGPYGIFSELNLSSFVKALSTENTNTAMLLASTGIVDDSDIDVVPVFTDTTSTLISTANNNGSSSNLSKSSFPQKAFSFPPPPTINAKYAHPVQDNGEMYFEAENDNGTHIVVYKSELSTIAAYALLNSKEMVMLNQIRYGTVDNKYSTEHIPENTKPLNVPSNPVTNSIEKTNVLLKSTFYPSLSPSQTITRPSMILTTSTMPAANEMKPYEGQDEKDMNQPIVNEDDSYQDYDDYNGSESDLYDELSSKEGDDEESDEFDEDDNDDEIDMIDEDEKTITNSPTLGPKAQNSSPKPLSASPTLQSQQKQQQQQQKHQQKQILSSEILKEELFKDLRSDDQSEIKYNFVNQEKCKISGTIYFAKQFYSLRRLCWCEEKDDTHYIRSLSNCRGWNVSGGKSKSRFDKTWDDRFILKEIKNTELEHFKDFAIRYFNYLADAFANSLSTQLVKTFGLYTISISTPDMSKKYSFIVMENLHYGYSPKKIFDLKGAVRNRFISDPSAVQLDGNLLRRKHY